METKRSPLRGDLIHICRVPWPNNVQSPFMQFLPDMLQNQIESM